MTAVELGSSGVGDDHSANCATTTAPLFSYFGRTMPIHGCVAHEQVYFHSAAFTFFWWCTFPQKTDFWHRSRPASYLYPIN